MEERYKLNIRIVSDKRAPPEIKKYKYEAAKQELGCNLLKVLYKMNSRVIVEIVEKEEKEYMKDILTLSVIMTNPQYDRVVVPPTGNWNVITEPEEETIWLKIHKSVMKTRKERKHLWGVFDRIEYDF